MTAFFGVATNRVWTDKAGAKQEATEFTNVVMWGRTAEIASQYLVKGATVLIEGRLQTRSWEDKQGQQRKTTEVLCERMQLGVRPAGEKPAAPAASKPEKSAAQEKPVIDIEDEGEGRALTPVFGEDDIRPEDIPF